MSMEMRATSTDLGAGFDDVLLGGVVAAAPAFDVTDPETDAHRRRVIAVALATLGVLVVVIAASVYGIAFLQGLSDGLSPR